MPPVIDISVAIPCYARAASLHDCLVKIAACDPLPREVLIHADGGTQVTDIGTHPWPFPVRILHSDGQLGPGGGRSRMIHQAASDLVASFDDDSWPLDPDYFARAVALMNAFPQAAVIGADVYLDEKPIRQPELVAYETNAFDGSASIHRRSHYLTLPGYVPLASAYAMEEVDLALQAHSAGLQIMVSPWLRAWHNRPLADFQHSTLPWIRNEWLHALLRYPWYAQPIGWMRVMRRLIQHWDLAQLPSLLRAALSAFDFAARLKKYKRHYTLRNIYQHHRGIRKRWSLTPHLQAGTLTTRIAPLPTQPRVLYLQYTNPGSYPPLKHSSQILAHRGWEVRFLGVKPTRGTMLQLPTSTRIHVHTLPGSPAGIRQKLHYLTFTLWSLWHTLQFRPDWIYCSDMIAAPATLVLSAITKQIVYHEHDSPTATQPAPGKTQRLQHWSRQRLAASADIVIVPNQQRLEALARACHPTGQTYCVWNCPSRDELDAPRAPIPPGQPIRLLYHGSINCERFPPSFLEALAKADPRLTLRLVGYETEGSLGYTQQLIDIAQRLGVTDRFEYLGPLPQRADLIARCAECDVGLSLLRIHPQDINMQHMAGASNKPFDYLSQGLAVLVPDDPAWRTLYVDHGCATYCVHNDTSSLIQAFNWLAAHPEQIRAMGKRGQEQIAATWNYETQFQPVLTQLEQAPTHRDNTPPHRPIMAKDSNP